MKNTLKETIATIGFWICGLVILFLIGYVIASISSLATTTADEYKSAEECRNANYAWHAVDGCTTQENFVNQYIDN